MRTRLRRPVLAAAVMTVLVAARAGAGADAQEAAEAVADGVAEEETEKGSSTRPCDLPEGGQLDFWLGEWELSWPAEQFGGEPGATGHGTNTITRILDDCIVHESFRFPGGGFEGESVSVYDPRAEVWRQTWVDSQGGYLVFTGRFEDGRMELRTEPRERDGKTFVSRMVFRNIAGDSLDWDWQRSDDGGESWQDVWNIHYQRKR